MPNIIRFRCTGVNNRINGGVARNAIVNSTATITFQVVGDEPMNNWFNTVGTVNANGNLNANGQFAITSNDPIVALAFQVGKDYSFSIDDWPEADLVPGEPEEPVIDLSCLNRAARKMLQSWLAVGAVKEPTIDAVLEALEKDLITPQSARTFFQSSNVACYIDAEGKLHMGRDPNAPHRQVGGVSDSLLPMNTEIRRAYLAGIDNQDICNLANQSRILRDTAIRELDDRRAAFFISEHDQLELGGDF